MTHSNKSKITLLTSIGAALEYYDFVIYAILASYISQAYFPATDHFASLLKTFGVFAIGYIIRPIGGILFGFIGDRYGRKKTFVGSIVLMAISTLGIGILPSYATIGILAPLLLILFRLLQGLSYGAEMPGAITFLTEHINNTQRGYYCGLVFLGVGSGAILASFVNFIFTLNLSHQQMSDWGWRLPFILGGALAIIGYFLRRNTQETPLFTEQPHLIPWREVFQHHKQSLLLGIGITFFPACFILFNLYTPAFLMTFYRYQPHQVYLAMTVGLLLSTLLLPLFGKLSDHIGRKKLMLIAVSGTILVINFLFYILRFESMFVLITFMLIYQFFVGMMAACYPSMLAELFPTKVRYTGVAICYNFSFAIAGLTPVVTTYLLSIIHHALTPSFSLMILGFFTLIAVRVSRDTTKMVLC